MIDTDKYKIADDVVWVWNDHPDDEGWVLWEYKECSEEGGGYPVGSDPNKTYEPYHQVLPSLIFECKIDERMDAITDLPLLLAEVKRLQKENDLLQIAFQRAGNFGLFMRLCNDCVTVHIEDDVCPHDCEFCGEWSINIPDGKQCCEVCDKCDKVTPYYCTCEVKE